MPAHTLIHKDGPAGRRSGDDVTGAMVPGKPPAAAAGVGSGGGAGGGGGGGGGEGGGGQMSCATGNGLKVSGDRKGRRDDRSTPQHLQLTAWLSTSVATVL